MTIYTVIQEKKEFKTSKENDIFILKNFNDETNARKYMKYLERCNKKSRLIITSQSNFLEFIK